MTVLILTSKDDVTADMVVTRLHEAAVPVMRLDPADLPVNTVLSAHYTRGDFEGLLSANGHVVSMQGLRSVWVRRPGEPAAHAAEPAAHAAEPSARLTAETRQALSEAVALWLSQPGRR